MLQCNVNSDLWTKTNTIILHSNKVESYSDIIFFFLNTTKEPLGFIFALKEKRDIKENLLLIVTKKGNVFYLSAQKKTTSPWRWLAGQNYMDAR